MICKSWQVSTVSRFEDESLNSTTHILLNAVRMVKCYLKKKIENTCLLWYFLVIVFLFYVISCLRIDELTLEQMFYPKVLHELQRNVFSQQFVSTHTVTSTKHILTTVRFHDQLVTEVTSAERILTTGRFHNNRNNVSTERALTAVRFHTVKMLKG